MEVHFFMPHWGNGHLSLEEFFKKTKDAGYHGVEMNIYPEQANAQKDSPDQISRLLDKYRLKLLGQLHIEIHENLDINPDGLRRHLDELTLRLELLSHLNPVLINSHTGKDFFSFDTNCAIINRISEFSAASGIKVIHEIHRGRFGYSTAAIRPFFEKFPGLEIAADFSHWCVVAESFLQDQPEIMQEAISRTAHIHARVGHPEGPQVNHPFAPEHKQALEIHLDWWKQIAANHKKKGENILTITTESGPAPYMPALPFTNQPVADLWDINVKMKDFLIRHL